MRLQAWSRCLELPRRPTWVSAGHYRRCDPLTRLLLGAIDALPFPHDSLPAEAGIIVHSAYGQLHATTSFLTSIDTHGDSGASPSPFTVSVHNAAAGMLGQQLGLHGPTTTIAQGNAGGITALGLARRLLHCHRSIPGLLVLGGDSASDWTQRLHPPMEYRGEPDGSGAWSMWVTRDSGLALETTQTGCRQIIYGPGCDRRAHELCPTGRRVDAARKLGRWFPTCSLAALPDAITETTLVLERDLDGSHHHLRIYSGMEMRPA